MLTVVSNANWLSVPDMKKVMTEARKSLERFFGKSIYLETFVKVDKDWRNSDKELNLFGYNPE
jgi:GTP-binding protein Era